MKRPVNNVNEDIRTRLRTYGIAYWEVAGVIGCHENTICRMMRTELDSAQREAVLNAVNTVLERRER